MKKIVFDTSRYFHITILKGVSFVFCKYFKPSFCYVLVSVLIYLLQQPPFKSR